MNEDLGSRVHLQGGWLLLCGLMAQQHLTGTDDAFRDLKAMGDGTDGGVLLGWLSKGVVMEQMGMWHDDWF